MLITLWVDQPVEAHLAQPADQRVVQQAAQLLAQRVERQRVLHQEAPQAQLVAHLQAWLTFSNLMW